MYNKNNLMRNVLITANEVIFHATTKHELDPRMVEQSIIVAEERFIVPALGYEMYNEIAIAKNTVVTDSNKTALNTLTGTTLNNGEVVNAFELLSSSYMELWKQYLWKLTAECVMACAYPEGFVQFGTAGTIHNNPPAGLMATSGFVTPLLSSLKWTMDRKLQDRIAPMANSMHLYLCRNIVNFPKYDKTLCPDCEKSTIGKSGGIALNLYDDEDETSSVPDWLKK